MKTFETHNHKVKTETQKGIIELALESGLFEIKSREEEGLDEWRQLSYYDAPYALVMNNEKQVGGYLECWGLDKEMSLKEALEDFDYLEEQRIQDILDACNIEYELIPI